MTTSRPRLSLILLGCFLALPAATSRAQEGGVDFMQVMQQMMSGGTNKTVNFRELKGLLPEELAGMPRTGVEGEKSSAMGVTIAFAEAEYEGDDRARLTVKITDLSAMGQMMRMAQMAWTQSEIDRESDEEYERTTTMNGHKAMEKYNHRQRNGEVQLMIDERFSVEIQGRNVEAETLGHAVNDLDLEALAALEPES